jgi:hypothetical protein
MSTPDDDHLDRLLDNAATEREALLLREAAVELGKAGEHMDLPVLRRLLDVQRLQLRETAQMRELLRALLQELLACGVVERAQLLARIVDGAQTPLAVPPTVAIDGGREAARRSPYRGSPPPAPRAGYVSCARCGRELLPKEIFQSADGRFCAACFDP